MAPPVFEFIRDGDHQLAVVVRDGRSPEKYNFATNPADDLQLGVTFYRDGDAVAPHAHRAGPQRPRGCQELVVVQSGRLECLVLRVDGATVASFELGPGEAVLFQDGAHALRARGDTRILEVKQGPHRSPATDKVPVAAPARWGEGER